MNKYYENFMKYSKLTENDYNEFNDLVNDVKSLLIDLDKKNIKGHAVIMLGYSGNGKSTFVKNFITNNQSYIPISFDSVERAIINKYGAGNYTGFDVVKLFGNVLNNILESGKNVIIDGNFLNLLTRCSLTNTLHESGYYATLVDLRPIFEKTIKNRIYDYASQDIGVKINEENHYQYDKNPKYIARENHIMNYHNMEKERAFVDLQDTGDCFKIGVEEVVDNTYCGVFKMSDDISNFLK